MNKFFPLLQAILLTTGVTFWQILFEFPEAADTYFVMNLGRYVLEHGFPYVDPFTIHENLQLVAQQWLSGIVFLEIYQSFGINGLLFTDAIIGAAMVLIHWRLCLYVSDRNETLSFVLSLIVGLLVMTSIVPRPHLFSTIFLLIEVFLLEKFTRTKDFKFLLPLPLLSVLLINLQAAMWLMLLVVCLPFLFVEDSRHVKFLLAAMGGIFLFGLINPYGVDAMTYVFRSYGVSVISENVREMSTPSAHSVFGKGFYLLEALVVLSLAKFKVPWRYIFLSGGITFMAIMNLRSVILFAFLATFPIAFAWKNFTIKKFSGRALPTILFLLLVTINTVLIVTLLNGGLAKISLPPKILFFVSTLFALYNLLGLRVKKSLFHPTILPRKILSLLVTAIFISGIYLTTLTGDKTPPDGNFTTAMKILLRSERPENISLYVPQGYGGLAGHFGIRYYIDARSEVFIRANNGQKDILQEYVDLRDGTLYYKDFFRRYDFTHIILTNETPFLFNQLSDDKNFRVIYESERVEGYKVIRCKIFVPPKNEE